MTGAVEKPDATIARCQRRDEGSDHREPVLGETMEADQITTWCTGLDPEGRYRGVKECL